MIKKRPNSCIRILPENLIDKYNIIQIEQIDYVYYIEFKQYTVTKFICEIEIEEGEEI